MKNLIWGIIIFGTFFTFLTIVASVLLLIFSLEEDTDPPYSLYFEDENENPVDGDVYLNERYIGKTFKGKLSIDEFIIGKVKLITEKDGKPYETYFILNSSDNQTKIIFQINFSDSSNSYLDYLNAIKFNDPELRAEATTYSKNCLSGDKECQIISIYENFLKKYKYFGDARDAEHIQTPEETKKFGGGDCEDLTILLNSLLENIGIETYMVFTKDHVYSLACDVDPDVMYNYTVLLFYNNELIENSTEEIILDMGEVRSYGWKVDSNESIISVYGHIKSNKPITIFAVENEKEFQAFMFDREYQILEDTYYENIKYKYFEYNMPVNGRFVIYNPYNQKAKVELEIEAYISYFGLDPENIKIISYGLNGTTCIPLDPSAGEISYAGFETQNIRDKVFINSLTQEQQEPSFREEKRYLITVKKQVG